MACAAPQSDYRLRMTTELYELAVPAFTRGFFKVAEVQKPKPQTIAIAMADAEFGRNACEGAHQNAQASGFKIVYEKAYPPSTTDFTPIVRAIRDWRSAKLASSSAIAGASTPASRAIAPFAVSLTRCT